MPDDTKISSALCPQCGKSLVNGSTSCATCGTFNDLGGHATLVMGANGPSAIQADNDALIGRTIEEKYQIIERLGAGAMGTVYRATRVNKMPDVAIKFLNKKLVSDSAALDRFIREANIAGSIEHDNVVRVYDWTRIEDKTVPAFIVMELVRGSTLASILKQQPLPVSRAVSLMCDICHGVGAAHDKNIIHRDIKPANVMICPDSGGRERVKILDFGLAKLYGKPDASGITGTGFVVGTPIYMSPEQYRGDELDARSDVYSLAAVMYEMFTGNPPFPGRTPDSIRGKHERGPRPFAGVLRIPRKLRDVILGALSLDPSKRPADANEFGRAVRNAVTPPEPAPRPTAPTTRPHRFDFGIISGDPEAVPCIKDVLGLHSLISGNHMGRNLYYWGAIQTDEGRQAYVVLSTPIERHAHVTDGEVVRNMIEVCDPEFVLVLGTARGLGAAGSQLGQVVYSRLVRSASSHSFNRDDFSEARNLPPDGGLLSLASWIASDGVWRRPTRLRKRTVRAPNPNFNPPLPIATEVFSTPNGHDDYSSQVFQTIRNLYPKVAAIETEAASVVHTLLGMLERGRSIGYLLVKGITDIIDDEALPEERKKRQQDWTQYASWASSTFAHSLIRRWRPAQRRAATIPIAYREVLSSADHNDRAHVFHGFHPERYSELCNTICADENGIRKVFAVCEFEPSYFIDMLTRNSGRSAEQLMKLDDAAFLDYANEVFPHFEAFRSLSEKGIEVNRVVLARDSHQEWRERNTDLKIELFLKLNGGVACYLAEVPRLRIDNLLHITDHVIFNSNLMLDYYDGSQTLIMTYDQDGLVGEPINFERHFERHKRSQYLYCPLNSAAGAKIAGTPDP